MRWATRAATLVERTETLQARMDNAENRFGKLARQADDAQKISETMAGVASAVGDAETRIGLVGESAHALEARTGQLDEMEERIRLLGQELEQRQGALDRATEHLARASTRPAGGGRDRAPAGGAVARHRRQPGDRRSSGAGVSIA